MLPKPDACRGCPLYGDGQGFVPDETRPDSLVTIVAQNPGEMEERGERVVGVSWHYGRRTYQTAPHPPAPLIGPTGWDLETTYLPLAKLQRTDVSLCNVLRCRWLRDGKRTNDLPPEKILRPAVEHCTREHLRIPPATRLVVAMGALAWRALGGSGSVSAWRGFLLQPESA